MLALSRDRSRRDALRRPRRDRFLCAKLHRDRRYSYLTSSASVSFFFFFLFSLTSDSPGWREDPMPGYDLGVARPCVRACLLQSLNYETPRYSLNPAPPIEAEIYFFFLFCT
ncbi:hypothetical protein PUN28_018870 [Cardiocondyla obscurior]|uniref:Uncharacterized protein n=1 Tax=Cardiocondyla obscurior TaxID=286306 RepID=A0AAW2ECE1_9HYME